MRDVLNLLLEHGLNCKNRIGHKVGDSEMARLSHLMI